MNEQSKRWIRLAGVVVGLALIVFAIVVVAQKHKLVGDALRALADPSPGLVVLLPMCVLGNLALTGVMFNQLMNRYGQVSCAEMQALIAASALANYLPLRPGLFGRVTYHAAVHRIPAKCSLLTIVQAIMLTACGAVVLLMMALIAPHVGVRSLQIMLPIPAIALAGAALVAGPQRVRPWCLAGLARYLDLLLWVARYAIAFTLIGSPIDLNGAVAFACVGTLTTMVPLSSNGLGLREWAVGLLAVQLAAAPLEMGITAELVNRAAEILAIAIAGVVGAMWLARRSRATSRPGRAP